MRVFAPALLAATTVVAMPVLEKRATTTPNTTDLLQYALTLEHLENAYYKAALQAFPEAAWIKERFLCPYYDNLKYIAYDEEQHVIQLTAAIKYANVTPVAACTYNFQFTDPASVVATSAILEGVGVSAYLNATTQFQDGGYTTGVAGSIMADEAKHTAIQRLYNGQIAFGSPYATPLGGNEVMTLAASYIQSCPPSNPPLPFKPFPSLMLAQGLPAAPNTAFAFAMPGNLSAGFINNVTATSNATNPSTAVYITWLSGLNIVSTAVNVTGSILNTTIPYGVTGQAYAVLTSANVTGMGLNDNVVVAGPAVVEVTPPSPVLNNTLI